MKPMTESEARAALKAEMPWAKEIKTREVVGIPGVPRWSAVCVSVKGAYTPMAYADATAVIGYAPTLRAAVAKAIRAWRATQKKGAKR